MSVNLPSLIEKINPIGFLMETYTRTLMYRAEIRRMDFQIEQIKIQSELMHSKIDKAYNIEIEKIKTRRAELSALYTTINNDLHYKHIERMELIKLCDNLGSALFNSNNSKEEKEIISSMIKENYDLIRKIGEQSNQSLDKLIDSLPKLENHKFLLIGDK